MKGHASCLDKAAVSLCHMPEPRDQMYIHMYRTRREQNPWVRVYVHSYETLSTNRGQEYMKDRGRGGGLQGTGLHEGQRQGWGGYREQEYMKDRGRGGGLQGTGLHEGQRQGWGGYREQEYMKQCISVNDKF